MQVTYIYNLFFYKLGGVCVKLNTQIFKLVLIFQARIKKCSMRLMARDETVFGEQNRAHSRGGTDRAGSGREGDARGERTRCGWRCKTVRATAAKRYAKLHQRERKRARQQREGKETTATTRTKRNHANKTTTTTVKMYRTTALNLIAPAENGASGPIRTADTRFRRAVLCPLSYEGAKHRYCNIALPKDFYKYHVHGLHDTPTTAAMRVCGTQEVTCWSS